jgi:assimilatory nitrate reductase electron transfer subunit
VNPERATAASAAIDGRTDSRPNSTTDGGICVVGAGLAANLLVRLLLEAEPEARISLFGAEPVPAYNRVLLPDVLAGRSARELVHLPHPAGPRLAVHTGVRVARIDREHRTLITSAGDAVGYSTLVLATGANPVLPPLPGLRDPGRPGRLRAGVHTLRSLADLDRLQAEAPAARRAVVVGGGLLGVQCSRALAALGPGVELIHQGPHLLDHRIDPAAGAILARTLRGHGIEVHTECRARAVTAAGDDLGPGPAGGVRLADGMYLDCDLVLVACGAAPAAGLAEAAGLAVRGGVVVDEYLRSVTDPAIHAIGDCCAPAGSAPAPHLGAWPGLAAPALAQAAYLAEYIADHLADHLAENPAGRAPRYQSPANVVRLGAAGIDVAVLSAAGNPAGAPAQRTVRLADPIAGTYRSVTVGGGRVLGSVLIGDVSAAANLSRLIDRPGPLPADPLDLLTTGPHPAEGAAA